MRRLALLAAAVLAVAAAPAARAEPLDIDLSRLGAPDPSVWTSVNPGGVANGYNALLARGARQRFALQLAGSQRKARGRDKQLIQLFTSKRAGSGVSDREPDRPQ